MNEDLIAKACEQIWELALKDTQPVSSCNTDRKPEGSYVSGFRDDIETWTKVVQGGKICATKTAWQKFDLGKDEKGTRRSVELFDGDSVVFRATQEGAITTQKFGAEEHIEREDHTPACEWKIDEGIVTLPFRDISA